MRILAIDTALDACAACVATDESDALLAEESLPLARGHAEALLPLIARLMARVEGGFGGLDRIAVTVGPGSYTGLRVGLAAARAIGLATGVPVVGVTTLSALLAPELAASGDGLIAAAIDARHGAVYLQAMSIAEGVAVRPVHVGIAQAAALLAGCREAEGTGEPRRLVAIGSGADALVEAARALGLPIARAETAGESGAPPIAWVASLGLVADPAQALPRPLYLRGPDAAPQDHARLARR